mmetsp:Transcript_30458/g.73461  ORF Transcript_30458/g.73461 Transcript_30458/m.73461 type:complete len:541 (-) Transcript_30458:406-2028(-)
MRRRRRRRRRPARSPGGSARAGLGGRRRSGGRRRRLRRRRRGGRSQRDGIASRRGRRRPSRRRRCSIRRKRHGVQAHDRILRFLLRVQPLDAEGHHVAAPTESVDPDPRRTQDTIPIRVGVRVNAAAAVVLLPQAQLRHGRSGVPKIAIVALVRTPLEIVPTVGAEEGHAIMLPVRRPAVHAGVAVFSLTGILVDVIYRQAALPFHYGIVSPWLTILDEEVLSRGIPPRDLVHPVVQCRGLERVRPVDIYALDGSPPGHAPAPSAQIRRPHPASVPSPALGHEIVRSQSRAVERRIVQVRQSQVMSELVTYHSHPYYARAALVAQGGRDVISVHLHDILLPLLRIRLPIESALVAPYPTLVLGPGTVGPAELRAVSRVQHAETVEGAVLVDVIARPVEVVVVEAVQSLDYRLPKLREAVIPIGVIRFGMDEGDPIRDGRVDREGAVGVGEVHLPHGAGGHDVVVVVLVVVRVLRVVQSGYVVAGWQRPGRVIREAEEEDEVSERTGGGVPETPLSSAAAAAGGHGDGAVQVGGVRPVLRT